MKPLHRKPVNFRRSARTFDKNKGRTKLVNLVGGGFRGGIRL
jgi:hypothetical protein